MGISKTDIGTTTISIIATLAVWEALIRIFHIPGFILPAPSAIVVEAVTRYQLYLYHSWITFYEMVVGFLLAVVVGVFLAVVIVYSRVIAVDLGRLLAHVKGVAGALGLVFSHRREHGHRTCCDRGGIARSLPHPAFGTLAGVCQSKAS